MRFAVLFTLLITLIGCATTAPPQSYRPRDYSGPAWVITGNYDSMSHTLTVLINGDPAIEGKLSAWDGSGSLIGKHEGYTVMANCESIQKGGTYIGRVYVPQTQERCTVLVDNEMAATLLF